MVSPQQQQQQPPPPQASSTKSYEFVIVGAGPSAMGLIYGLLSPYQSSTPPFSIAVIERGSGPPHARSMVSPAAWFTASHSSSSSSVNLLSSTLPPPPSSSYGQYGRRILDVPTGQGLGGTTNVHAGLCTPPSGDDFVTWPKPWREDMMESVCQIQDVMVENGVLQYDENNSNLLVMTKSSSSCRAVNDGDTNDNAEDGDENDDDNAMPLVGNYPWREMSFPSLVMTIPLSAKITQEQQQQPQNRRQQQQQQRRLERVNYHDGLIVPLLQSYPHLQHHVHWYSSVQVERLVWEDHRVVGVECRSLNACTNSTTTTATTTTATTTTSSSSPQQNLPESSFHLIHASRHVILCAGALETPALLLVSGIGPANELTKAGVSNLRQSLPGVGTNLGDHVMVPRAMLTIPTAKSCWTATEMLLLLLLLLFSSRHKPLPSTLSINGVVAMAHARLGTNKYQLLVMDATSFTTVLPHLIAGFVRRDFTKDNDDDCDISPRHCRWANIVSQWLFYVVKWILWLVIAWTPLYFVLRYFVVAVNLVLLNPTSRGTVRVVTKQINPVPAPLRRCDVKVQVRLNYLANQDDVDALQEGWQSLNTRLCQNWFPQSVELFPGVLYRGMGGLQTNLETTNNTFSSSSWFPQFAHDFCLPYFHWCGTCAMSVEQDQKHTTSNHQNNDKMTVVDSRLRVLNVPSLRICDASVFPTIISGPTALTCAALGLRFGKMLLEEMSETSKKMD